MLLIKNAILLLTGGFLGWFIRAITNMHYHGLTLIKTINQDYANVIGLVISLTAATITTVYVIFTYRQMKASERSTALAEQSAACSELALRTNQEMVNSMKQQLKQATQPLIIVENVKTVGTACFYKKRRQLLIMFDLHNIGTGPAVSVYVFGWFHLKDTRYDDSNLIPMDFLPDYHPYIAVDQKACGRIRFETHEITGLILDLEATYQKNIERINRDASEPSFRNADIIIRIFYKNITNQLYEVLYSREISFLRATDKENPETDKDYNKAIPPKRLKDKDKFQIQFGPEIQSRFDVKIASETELMKLIETTDWTRRCELPNDDDYVREA